MRGRVVRIERDGALVFLLSLPPVPIVSHLDEGERGVTLSQVRVEFARALGRRLRFGHRIARREDAVITQERVRVGDTGVGERVSRVVADRLVKRFNRFSKTLFVAPIPKVTTAQVSLI